jgi:hypothetical protein
LLDELAHAVDERRGSFLGELQPRDQPAAGDADILPGANDVVGVVVEQRDRVFQEAVELFQPDGSTTSP